MYAVCCVLYSSDEPTFLLSGSLYSGSYRLKVSIGRSASSRCLDTDALSRRVNCGLDDNLVFAADTWLPLIVHIVVHVSGGLPCIRG